MAWLVAQELPAYPVTDTGRERIVGALRHPARSMSFDAIETLLRRAYPTARKIWSPMERADPGATVVTVYLSCRKDGHGRIVCNFQLWGISR